MKRLVPLLLLALLAACGEVTTTAGPEPGAPSYTWSEDPSPVVLRLDGGDVTLQPWSYCWSGPKNALGQSSGVCADGSPGKVEDLPEVSATAAEIAFWFGRPGWTFSATFVELDRPCPHRFPLDAVRQAPQEFTLGSTGPAGRYQVDFFGRGPEGDVAASFVWRVARDQPVAPPKGQFALISDNDGKTVGYSPELGLSNLAGRPSTATTSVLVTAANGRSLTLSPTWEQGECFDAGSVFFRGPDADGARAAALGSPPFRYEVTVTLDGKEYVGTGVWPRDEIKDYEPYVELDFSPALPAFRG